MQHASQIDYHTVKALAERSGLHLLEVYRLLQGERVKNPDAWNRLEQARLELVRQQERQAAMRPK
jgi:hypothetical protein